MKVYATLITALAMLVHAAVANEYVWQEDKPTGNFSFSKVDMKLQGGGTEWKPRAIAQVVMQGHTKKPPFPQKRTRGRIPLNEETGLIGSVDMAREYLETIFRIEFKKEDPDKA